MVKDNKTSFKAITLMKEYGIDLLVDSIDNRKRYNWYMC